ncbi:rhodanese-like domain-containing protein [Mycolicibacterium smegmatis]|uniref:Rhodanese domain protein/cystathionine beta-lyase n=1 Tax=Mycolicibacterium smegmatis (strain MKD8) TaxID=1214915 RepID=A0A2U9PUM2_MYCSE|nr:rhodanese-like domain-containing protein [Mycolicibacterium smegmatis]AWT55438.1 rhodanese domain protein/cystathionine beta-lyase [Mycolicibacterium smegmatis MKD8]
MAQRITAAELLDALQNSDRQLALLDLRSPLERSHGHIAVSAGLPWHDVEQHIADLVPFTSTPIVLASRPELDERGAELLERLGYRDVSVLADGLDGWKSAGGRIYTGTNVRSKTLGEWIEHTFGTPTVDGETVDAWRAAGEDVVFLDSRTPAEYRHHHIPGGHNTGGGAEIAYRAAQVVKNPNTKVVINCQGRTRGIVGAQSLINTGIANLVFSLHNGTPAWEQSGRPLEFGTGSELPAPAAVAQELKDWARRTLAAAGAQVIDLAEAQRYLDDTASVTYLLDVRSPGEFAEGHFTAAVSAPGGQLVQATDEYVAVHKSRLVLADTGDFVRAANTVQWLRYLHDGQLTVVAVDPNNAGADLVRPNRLSIPTPAVPTVSAAELAALDSAQLVDLRSSTQYAAGHLPGSVHARREHLADIVAAAGGAPVVLVGDADFVAEHLVWGLDGDVRVLTGGIEAVSDVLTDADPRHAGEIVDLTGAPDFGPERDAWYEAYFAWELNLLTESEGDPFFDFAAVSGT